MEDISVFSRNYSPKSFELFWHAFGKKSVFHSPRCVYVWKNCAFSPEYRPLPMAAGGIEDLGHSFFQYVPSGW